MTDPLPIEERISLALSVGESHFREFKSCLEGAPNEKRPRSAAAISTDIARTLVAFANADGGELLVGVEDDGSVTGVPHTDAALDTILQAAGTHVHPETPLPSPLQKLVPYGQHKIFYLRIPKGADFIYLTADGRCIRRDDRDSVPVAVEAISAKRLEDASRKWERSFLPTARLDDLDLDLVDSVAAQIAYGISAEKCLQYLDLAEFSPEGLLLRNAALMLFAKDIRRWHPRCQVRIMQVAGRERLAGEYYNVERDEVVADSVLRLVDSAWERLTLALGGRTHLTDTVRFQQTHMFPQLACREALINAIVHRNYAIEGRGIEVSIFNDRLEIVSPGELLTTVSLVDLEAGKGVHESRNPLMARVLREVGFVREMGEGVVRILDVMRSNALAAPEFRSDRGTFSVTLHSRSMYPEDVRLWLSNFEGYALSDAQTGVLALGYGGRAFSTQDIIDRLGIVDTDQIREILTPLRSMGMLERTADHKALIKEARRKRMPKRGVPSYRVVVPDSNDKTPKQGVRADAVEEEGTAAEYELYVGNIPYEAEEGAVSALFEADASVLSIKFPGAKTGRKNNGYAFVTVEYDGEIGELASRLDGQRMGGRGVRVQRPRRDT